MSEKREPGSKKVSRPKSPFKQISKGDLVTIHDGKGKRKGHATRREYGNWVLVLERNMGTALATKENTVAVSKPKMLARPPRSSNGLSMMTGGGPLAQSLRSAPARRMYYSTKEWNRASFTSTIPSGWTTSSSTNREIFQARFPNSLIGRQKPLQRLLGQSVADLY